MSDIINKSMSSDELRYAFYCAIDGMGEEQRDELTRIREEYHEFIPSGVKVDLDLAKKGWLS